MKNGFTLVEPLGVIVILSLLSLIVATAVGSIITNASKSLSDKQKNEIQKAAEEYYMKEGMNINDTCISVSELLSKGYIKGTQVIDPETEEQITGYVRISYSANQYSFVYQETSCE